MELIDVTLADVGRLTADEKMATQLLSAAYFHHPPPQKKKKKLFLLKVFQKVCKS